MDKDRYIWLNGEKIPVSEEVYRALKRPEWAERKRRKVRQDRELSMDILSERDHNIPVGGPLVHEILEDKQLLDYLLVAVSSLDEKDRVWLSALYKTEREVAKERGVSQNTVNYHKKRIVSKLQDLLKKYL